MRQQTNPRPRRGRNSGRRPGPQRNQNFDSNGPSVRVRGNAYQVMEKYLTLARDATTTGDRIAAENYYQHAEHYFRILNVNSDANANGGGRDNSPKTNGQHRGRPEEKRADGNKAEEARPSESKAANAEAGNAKPDESKAAKAEAGNAKPDESKAEKAEAGNAEPDESKAEKAEAGNAKPGESKAAKAKAADAKDPGGADEKSAKGSEPTPAE